MSRRLRLLVALVVTTVSIGGIAVLGRGSAQAALPTCTTIKRKWLPVYFPAAVRSDGSVTFDCIMGPGNQSPAVARLQRSLNRCNPPAPKPLLDEDGVYGPKTKAAVVALQKRYKLDPDGIYGPKTSWAMYHYSTDVKGNTTCPFRVE